MLAPLAILNVPSPAVRLIEPFVAEMVPPAVKPVAVDVTLNEPPELPDTVPDSPPCVTFRLAFVDAALNCRLPPDNVPLPVTDTPLLFDTSNAPVPAEMLPALASCGVLIVTAPSAIDDSALTVIPTGA